MQVSLQTQLGAAHHIRLGEALAPLRKEGVLIIGSGHLTHNLREWIAVARRHGLQPVETDAKPYVREFGDWVDEALRAGDGDRLGRWKDLAPHAARAHPSDEHFLPLPFAFGAAGPNPQVKLIRLGVDSGVLAMDSYVFEPR